MPLSIPSPPYAWQVFNIGQWLRDIGLSWFPWNLNIHTYALCILVGIVAAGIVTGRRLRNRGAEAWVVVDVMLWAVPLGIIGGRIFHVLTHPADYFYAGANLLKTLYIWEGGMAIFGALILGGVGAFIGCRMSGLRFWSFADALAPGLLLAQAFGRFGNYFNHELFGLPTDLPWGLQIESTNAAFPAGLPAGTLFQPTFLYEIIWNLIGIGVLLLIERKWRRVTIVRADGTVIRRFQAGEWRMQWGKMLGAYLIWYGLGRSYLESIRVDPSEIFFGIRTNIWAAFGAIALGIVIIIVQSRRHPGLEPSPYLPGRQWLPDRVVHSENYYSDTDDDGDDAAPSKTPVHRTSK